MSRASALRDPPIDLGRVGSYVANYRLLDVLGRGALGTVYRAEHVHLRRQVAIKVLHPELAVPPELAARYFREACAAARIGHPGIVEVIDFGWLPDRTGYLVMEYLEGHPLSHLLERRGPWPLGRAVHLVLKVAHALAAAHREQIVHREVSPRNVIVLEPRGRPVRVIAPPGTHALFDRDHLPGHDLAKLGDFGLATLVQSSPAPAGLPCSSEHRAPELVRGAPADARTDVYGLGMLLYELVTGQSPFVRGPADETLRRVMHEPPPPPRALWPAAELTADTEQLILHALAKDPDRRPASADDFVAALRRCVPA